MTDSPKFANNTDPASEPNLGDEGWSGSDIEEAYLKALQAMEDVAWEERIPAQAADAPDSPPSIAVEIVPQEALAAGAPATAPAPADEAPSEVKLTAPQTPAASAAVQPGATT